MNHVADAGPAINWPWHTRYIDLHLVSHHVESLRARCIWSQHVFCSRNSFFQFHVTQEIVSAGERSKLKLAYSPPVSPGGGDFDGYVGFANLEISGDTEGFRRGLQKAYKEYRSDVLKVVTVFEDEVNVRHENEMNPLHAFVYNSQLDITKFDIGVKYNESWYDFGGKSPVRPGRTGTFANRRYVSFLSGEAAALSDWQMSKLIEPLGVDIRDGVNWWESGKKLETPVLSLRADQSQIVVFPFGILNSQISAPETFSFMKIDSSGKLTKYIYENGRFTTR